MDHLGQDDPGKVLWAPAVFEAAKDHGLKLAKSGRLIDTSGGKYELRDVEVAEPPKDDSLRDLRTPPSKSCRPAWCGPTTR